MESTSQLTTRQPIFVFGSNLAGRHGKGAALEAVKKHGAVHGRGIGRQGNSYAIPTKDEQLRTLSRAAIELYVAQFKDYARRNPLLTFAVTKIGCGLAGYNESDIKPMFANAPENCQLPEGWSNA